jgi:hypothetical protein
VSWRCLARLAAVSALDSCRVTQGGETAEVRAAAAAVEAPGHHEADAGLLGDVVPVAARQEEAGAVGVEQALVAAQRPLDGELIASLRGLR